MSRLTHLEILRNLENEGISLEPYPEPHSKYVPIKRVGSLLYFSGQLSAMEYPGGNIVGYRGRLGSEVDVAFGKTAARHCAVGLLGRALTELRDLGRIVQIVRLTGYINSDFGFPDNHLVMNGCSELLMAALGVAGLHTRLAIGVPALSFNTTVEVDCVMEVV